MAQFDRPLSTFNPNAPVFRPDAEPQPPIEIEIEEETILTPDGGAIITLAEDNTPPVTEHNDNLVESIDNDDLDKISSELLELFETDRLSRSDWEKTYIHGLNLLGLKFEKRSQPWDGACGVFHPMLAESVIRFQSQAIQEIFPAKGPAKTAIVGKVTPEKTQQAKRVQEYLNYLTTKQMTEYRNETDKLLFLLPIAGSAFRKIYNNETYDRPAGMFVPAEDFVVSYSTTDLTTCERATHILKRTPNQVRKSQVAGFYTDIELPEPTVDEGDIKKKYDEMTGTSSTYEFDGNYTFLEMHVDYDMPGFEDIDGVALPYVVTIDKSSAKIMGIRRNWLEPDPLRIKREHFIHYQYLPGLGFYGFGLVHMIGGLSESATSLLRQLVDAGTLANLPGGFKSRSLRIKGDDTPIKPGEFRDVDVPMGGIRDNIAFMPYKEPSGVLYQLLKDLVQEGRRFASAADVKVADMNGEAPVGTTLAILEREMKVLSAIQARLHAAMGQELVLLSNVVKQFGPENYPYEVEGVHTLKEDFDERVDVIPVSDPNAGTMAQRIMQWQAALQLAGTAPQLYDLPMLHRGMIETLGIENADKIIPTEDDMTPKDPVTENMAIINGEPVKAILYQDHEAHIQVHMAAQKNPQMMEILKEHPNIKAVAAAGAAHIAEHVAFAYRRKIEEELGVPLPHPDEPLPEDIELRLSRLVAPAAAQVTGKAQKQQQAEKNAEQQKDPIIQMQKEELALKKQTQQAKAKEAMAKVQADLKKAGDKDRLEHRKLAQKGKIDAGKLALDVAEQQSSDEAEGFKIGLQLAKDVRDDQKGNSQRANPGGAPAKDS